MPPWQHFKNICYHIRQADALGFHAAILLTGHYGPNWEDLKELVRLIQPFVGTRLYGLPEFESNAAGFDGDGQRTGDHAGKVETSLLWALRPECVDMSRIPAEYEPRQVFAMGQDAPQSNRLAGERMVAAQIEWLGAKSAELLAEFDRLQPAHTLTTFAAVEHFWRDILEPVLPNFKSMQERWEWQEPLASDSPWKENNGILW
jgi:creatinine amidohydrolase